MDYSKLTLGELLSSTDETIQRCSMSILKQLMRKDQQAFRDKNCIKNEAPSAHQGV